MFHDRMSRKIGLRTLAGAAIIAGLSLSPVLAHRAAADNSKLLTFKVTLTDTTYAQGFSFPVAATAHQGFDLFQVGQQASTQAAAIAQDGNPLPMFNLLQSARSTGDVTGVYVNQFPVASAGNPNAPWPAGLPEFNGTTLKKDTPPGTLLSDSIAFTITAHRGDVFSLAMMMMCTNDGLAGLDAVHLPQAEGASIRYPVFAYDAGVEANTEQSTDIVDPCGLMAPYTGGGAVGSPQVPTNDGNQDSPPTGSVTVDSHGLPLAQHAPIAPSSNPTITGVGNIPTSFAWDANAPVGWVTITNTGS